MAIGRTHERDTPCHPPAHRDAADVLRARCGYHLGRGHRPHRKAAHMTALVPAAKFLRHQPLNPTGRPHMDGGAEPAMMIGVPPQRQLKRLFPGGPLVFGLGDRVGFRCLGVGPEALARPAPRPAGRARGALSPWRRRGRRCRPRASGAPPERLASSGVAGSREATCAMAARSQRASSSHVSVIGCGGRARLGVAGASTRNI